MATGIGVMFQPIFVDMRHDPMCWPQAFIPSFAGVSMPS
jgi:hypothetical protein